MLVAQLVKNLPPMREIWVRSLGWEDPLEKGTATHSRILAWKIPWDHKELDTTEQLSLSDLPCSKLLAFRFGSDGKESACNAGDLGWIPGLGRSPGEGNSYPLQCPSLENPMDSSRGRKESDMTE